MISEIKRHIVLYLTTFIFMSSTFAHEAVETFIADSSTDSLGVAVMVIDLKNGKTIAEYNIHRPLIPASVTKAVTIASLIEEIGIDYNYETPVYITGKICNGILDGNILIKASGDPSINSLSGPASNDFITECIDALTKHNIVCISGDIIIDQSVFSGFDVPQSWQKGDLGRSYGTGSHGFNFENNCSGKASVTNPTEVFKTKFYRAASSANIKIEHGDIKNVNGSTLLVCHKSAPIDEIMRSCMMRSDNLYAEVLLRTLSMIKSGKGDTSDGTSIETAFWEKKKIPMDNVKIIDGSGLSRQNRFTADFLANVLKKMSDNVDFVSFFPLAGQEGTLRNFLKGTSLDSYIAMKTGSMTGVQCYAGYKLDEEYAPTHVVVILMNNFSNRSAIKNAAEKMLLKIFCNESI